MARRLIPDDLWRLIESYLPERPARPQGGRPIVQDRAVLTGIIFVLKTGIAWDDLPDEMGCGCGMTCFRRLREWHRQGIWEQIQPILGDGLPYGDRVDWDRAVRDVRPKRTALRQSEDCCVPAEAREAV